MTETATILPEIRKSGSWLVTLGALLLLGGLVCLGRPLYAGLAVAIVLGWALLAGGIMYLVSVFTAGRAGHPVLRLVMAALYAVAGIWLIAEPGMGLALLTLILGIAILLEGIVTLVYAFSLPPFLGKGAMVLSSILGIVAGILIWAHWPESSALVIGWIVGLRLLFAGLTFLWLGLAIKKLTSLSERS